ncbi:hypothetical protein PTKU15_80510 [Paraburkholderia terrae]|nr:hypothetical protein PTKU15_80510 [Paraburkholderia terrae]
MWVRHFGAALDVPCAFTTECTGWPPKSVQTLAYWLRDDFRESIEFELAGTPCEALLSNAAPYCTGVGKLFHRDKAYESHSKSIRKCKGSCWTTTSGGHNSLDPVVQNSRRVCAGSFEPT